MRVVSVNVGRAAPLMVRGRTTPSAIRKRPVTGPVAVLSEHLDGDESADRRVHGGPEKAVYAYPVEHYAPWQAELGLGELPFGSFGENLTVEDLLEDDVRLGDVLAIGTAELAVTRPRFPCQKLNARFERDDMGVRMVANSRSGFYLRVHRTGTLAAGDEVCQLASDPSLPTVGEAFRRQAHSG